MNRLTTVCRVVLVTFVGLTTLNWGAAHLAYAPDGLHGVSIGLRRYALIATHLGLWACLMFFFWKGTE